jgi:tRNA G46 methylase TrmB
MVDYLPEELWKRPNLKIIDTCCGNGNFGAYIATKTSCENIWFNELSKIRYDNCKKILNPKHLTNVDAFSIDSYGEWDLSVANPPYSGGGNKNQSLSNKFIEHSIKLLKDGGYLCFITPNNWMTYNNSNTTLEKLLKEGSFLVIDSDVKKYFPGVGSSFVVFIWQKGVFNHKTKIINNFVIKDVKENVIIPKDIKFIPLYISDESLSLSKKLVTSKRGEFNYRCDLHNFTKKDLLSDEQNDVFQYRTIHTTRKTRYAKIKQDIYDKWIVVVPLSTYFIPFVEHNANVTQSVGYIQFDTEDEAKTACLKMKKNAYKTIVHLTRYGNFNNIMVLKHIDFSSLPPLSDNETTFIENFVKKINY